jgi:hypothetical protein
MATNEKRRLTRKPDAMGSSAPQATHPRERGGKPQHHASHFPRFSGGSGWRAAPDDGGKPHAQPALVLLGTFALLTAPDERFCGPPDSVAPILSRPGGPSVEGRAQRSAL